MTVTGTTPSRAKFIRRSRRSQLHESSAEPPASSHPAQVIIIVIAINYVLGLILTGLFYALRITGLPAWAVAALIAGLFVLLGALCCLVYCINNLCSYGTCANQAPMV